MRAIKGLGVENCASIVRTFKTPFLLHMCYSQLPQDVKICENLLTAGKLELASVNGNSDPVFNSRDSAEGNAAADVPMHVQDSDRVNLGTVVSSCQEKGLLNKLLKNIEKEMGIKVRKVNKTQSVLVWQLICYNKY